MAAALSFQTGTMTLDTVDHVLAEARQLGTIEWIYFEGGEAFLYYAILQSGVLRAKKQGFKVGIVTNAYWANSESDALEWLHRRTTTWHPCRLHQHQRT